jgi:hypothetical protein
VEGSAAFPFLSLLCGAGSLRAWAGDAPRNSDEHPRLELRAALDRFRLAGRIRDLERVLAVLKSGS